MEIKLSEHFTYKKLLRFCLSPIVMMVFTSIYGVVDGFFVSNFAGKTSFAAINLVMPFIMVLGGFGFMVASGASALVAKTLGEKDVKRANEIFSMAVKFTVILGVITTVVGIVFMRPISVLLGAEENMITDCVVYGRTVLAFNTAFMLQNGFQIYLSVAEKPKLGLYYTVAAGLTNMVLDAVFVGLFNWGVAGAAVATGISQCVGGILPIFYFIKKNDTPLRLVNAKCEARPLIKACTNGSSELMSSVSSSIVSALYNFQLLKYAGQNGVATYGVLMYIQFIFVAIFIGYTIGMSPIVSYNYGAQNKDELKSLFRKSVIMMSAAGIIMMILGKVLASPLSEIFVGYDDELCAMATHAFGIFAYAFVLTGINIFASALFTALNNGAVSAIISFLRTLVFQSVTVIVFPIIFDIDGIWYAITFAEVFAFIISVSFIIAKRKKYGYA